MSRVRAWTMAGLLDRAQAGGILPVVNPTKGDRKADLPAPMSRRRAAVWFVLTCAVVAGIVLTTMLLNGRTTPFIYSEF